MKYIKNNVIISLNLHTDSEFYFIKYDDELLTCKKNWYIRKIIKKIRINLYNRIVGS